MIRTFVSALALAIAPLLVPISGSPPMEDASRESEAVRAIRRQVAAGGPVTIPPGVHLFRTPLVLKQNGTLPTSLQGGGPELSILDFSKLDDPRQAAIRIDREWGYRLQGFTVRGSGRSNGVGIDVNTTTPNKDGSYGTCSGQSVWDQLTIAGFSTGIRIGNRDKYIAASEMVYQSLKVVQCKTCIELNDFNTLNHLFTMLQIGDCDVGMQTNGASSISVLGGSASGMRTVGFRFANTDKASLRDFRIEDSACGITFGTTTTVTQLLVENCQFHQPRMAKTNKDSSKGTHAIVVGGSANAVFNSCNFDMGDTPSPILWAKNGPDGSITVNNGSATCQGNLVTYGKALAVANPGRLTVNNVARTKPGHVPHGWFDAMGAAIDK